ncbi:MAG: Serine-protein kinase RsbW [Chlamydiales bacterium]|nr:Serine-protein kinase RsbW [Chlamydiales bacterium]MCH9619759.1 Serine-protein kinase RsbW [Chlamydiales bacterium]MCH9623365.1 Serine-protein kinase RsbW [Chlamydiales bacterium]
MLTFVCDEGKKGGVPKEFLGKMELACEEALVNIISHGNPPDELAIICKNRKGRFEVIIRDHGTPFNPIESMIEPQLDLPISDRKIGGLGIYLIRTLLDESIYQRVEDENVLRLALRYRA